jgi:hypothetical protein
VTPQSKPKNIVVPIYLGFKPFQRLIISGAFGALSAYRALYTRLPDK